MHEHEMGAWARGSLGTLLAAALLSTAAEATEIKPLWRADLDDSLQGRIYQTLVLPGTPPRVVATTPDQVVAFEAGKASSLFRLERDGSRGRSAVLPTALLDDAQALPLIGLLVHDHHAVAAFELSDLAGNVLVKVDDARNFYYRLAPDGTSFVGIDAGTTHAALTADSVKYRFFDREGKPVKREPVSRNPAQRTDSAYTPDGELFLINSIAAGLAAYDPDSGGQQWAAGPAAHHFAASNAPVGLVLADVLGKPGVVTLISQGKPVWALSLEQLGIQEPVRDLAMSPNGRHLVVATRSALLLMSPNDDKPLAVVPAKPGAAINSITVGDTGVVLVGMQDEDLRGGEVWFLDAANGQPVADVIKTRHARSNAWIPMVQLDAGGKRALVRTLERLELYSIDAGTGR